MHRPRPLLVALLAAMTTACTPAGLAPVSPVGTGAPGAAAMPAQAAPPLQRTRLVPADPAAAEVVAGLVSYGAPIAGATVTATGADGQDLGKVATTNARGAFAMMARGLPAAFTLTATGGTVDGKPFAGRMSAVVRGLSRTHDNFMLDVPSTMAAEFLRSRPASSPEAARSRAAEYLGLGPVLRPMPLTEFDAAAFSAAAGGGFDAYVASLGQAMVRAQAGSRSFLRAGASPAVAPAAGVPARAVLAFGIPDIGALLNPTPPPNPNPNPPAVIVPTGHCFFTCTPAQAGSPLTIDQQDVDIINATAHAIDDMATFEAELMQEFRGTETMADYLQRRQALDHLIAMNWGLLHDLLITSQLSPAPAGTAPADDPLATRMREVLGKMDQVAATGLQSWDAALTGPGGDGLIKAMSRFLGRHGRFYGPTEATAMGNWWAHMDAQQAATAYLAAKYAAIQGRADGPAILAGWKEGRRAQLALLRGMPTKADPVEQDVTLNALPPGVAVLKANRTMWNTFPTYITKRGKLYNMGAVQQMRGLFQDWRVPTLDDGLAFTKADVDDVFRDELQVEGFKIFAGDAILVDSQVTVTQDVVGGAEELFQDVADFLFSGRTPDPTFKRTFNFQFIIDGYGVATPKTDDGAGPGIDFDPDVWLYITRTMGAAEPMPFWP